MCVAKLCVPVPSAPSRPVETKFAERKGPAASRFVVNARSDSTDIVQAVSGGLRNQLDCSPGPLDLFCAASHSIDPLAHWVWTGGR